MSKFELEDMAGLNDRLKKLAIHDKKIKPKNRKKPILASGKQSEVADFECYYESQKRIYWIKNSREGWITATESHLKRQLRQLG